MNHMMEQIPIVPGTLAFARCKQKPQKGFFFCIEDLFDDSLYEPFCYDFGPPNFGQIYLFCKALSEAIQTHPNQTLCFCATENSQEMTNALCLLGAYCILVLDWPSEKTNSHLKQFYVYTTDYRDASTERRVIYGLKLLPCFEALRKGKDLGWLNLSTFNHDEYTFYERVENGDFNWIVPEKLLAVCSPTSIVTNDEETITHLPCMLVANFTRTDDKAYYIKYFKEHGIDTIVRLCKAEYEASEFLDSGISHHDMYFIDGTTPPIEIVHQFLHVAKEAKGVAVHCKQGLGRTGTLIACYLIKHFGFGAADSIAFLRIQRPGSVVGPQQEFLHQVEGMLKETMDEDVTQDDSKLLFKKRSFSEAQIPASIPIKSTKLQKTEAEKKPKAGTPSVKKKKPVRVSV